MKALRWLFATACVLVASAIGGLELLDRYDEYTRQHVLNMITSELPVGASTAGMATFLQRHTTELDLDDRFNHVYNGFMPQSDLDRWLFWRHVRINLQLDEKHHFKGANVNIFYKTL